MVPFIGRGEKQSRREETSSMPVGRRAGRPLGHLGSPTVGVASLTTGSDRAPIATPGLRSAKEAALDTRNFASVYYNTYEDVSRWIRALGGPSSEQDDLIQDIYLIVHGQSKRACVGSGERDRGDRDRPCPVVAQLHCLRRGRCDDVADSRQDGCRRPRRPQADAPCSRRCAARAARRGGSATGAGLSAAASARSAGAVAASAGSGRRATGARSADARRDAAGQTWIRRRRRAAGR
jgi:hypothetical protein